MERRRRLHAHLDAHRHRTAGHRHLDLVLVASPSATRTATAPAPTATATASTTPAGNPNRALGKAATQSSNPFGGDPSRAVDGNTDGNWAHGSVIHTDRDLYAWWQVDLGAVGAISNVDIWNRTDCCSERLSGFYVFVSDVPFASTDLTATLNQSGVSSYFVAGTAGTPTTVSVFRSGRYVRVQLNRQEYLSIAEVQVWDGSVAPPTPTSSPNPTATSPPSPSPTSSPVPSHTAVAGTPTRTATPSRTPTSTQTGTPTKTPTRTQTPTKTSTPTKTATPTRTPTKTAAPGSGPIITHLSLVRPDGCIIGCFNGFFCACAGAAPTPERLNGIPVYPAQGGRRGLIVVEVQKGATNAAPGTTRVAANLCADRPALQVQADRGLGDNPAPLDCNSPTANACDNGIPGISPPGFGPGQSVTTVLNQFGCRFSPAITSPGDACTLNYKGDFGFLGPYDATKNSTQFCDNVTQSAAFNEGDTLITLQVEDINGVPGPTAQMIVRVPTATPTPAP